MTRKKAWETSGPICEDCGEAFVPERDRRPWPHRCPTCRRERRRHHWKVYDAKRNALRVRVLRCQECGEQFDWLKPGPSPVVCPKCLDAYGKNGTRYVMDRKHRWHVKKTYGLGPDAVEQLITRQKGLCAVCRKPPADGERLHVDHDHSCCGGSKSCGKCVRGLVCRPCNQAMGLLDDDKERMERLIRYLRRHMR